MCGENHLRVYERLVDSLYFVVTGDLLPRLYRAKVFSHAIIPQYGGYKPAPQIAAVVRTDRSTQCRRCKTLFHT